MSEHCLWPFESKDDQIERQTSELLIRDAEEGLTDEDSTARHPLVRRLAARLDRIGARLWDAVENRVISMSNIEQVRILKLVQKEFYYEHPYSAPIWIDDGRGYLTGRVSMSPLLELKTNKEIKKEIKVEGPYRNWWGYFRFRHAIETFQGATASEPRWRPEPELITADPCGIVALKDGTTWEVRPEFYMSYYYNPSDMPPDVLFDGEHKVTGEWRTVGKDLSDIAGILTRMASGRLFV